MNMAFKKDLCIVFLVKFAKFPVVEVCDGTTRIHMTKLSTRDSALCF